MPRVKVSSIKKRVDRYIGPIFSFTDAQREALIAYFPKLSTSENTNLIRAVENAVGSEVSSQKMSAPPTSAAYVAAFEPVLKQAAALRETLKSLPTLFLEGTEIQHLGLWRDEKLLADLKAEKGFEPQETVVDHLIKLESAAKAIISRYRIKESRGGPRNDHMLFTVERLRELFAKHANDNSKEIEFIHYALRAAKVIAKKIEQSDEVENVAGLVKRAKKLYETTPLRT